ncbi:hypothetical protein Ddc_06837 [Ditylenchus destructor]|nr:hypothetical protein Ddc_06837 [Ditylenchus destructor]
MYVTVFHLLVHFTSKEAAVAECVQYYIVGAVDKAAQAALAACAVAVAAVVCSVISSLPQHSDQSGLHPHPDYQWWSLSID